MSFLSFVTENTTPADVWNLHPGLSGTWSNLPSNILNTESELTRDELALIISYYASVYANARGISGKIVAGNGMRYIFGDDQKVDEVLLDQLLVEPQSADLNARLLPVILFVRKLARESYKLLQRDADAIYKEGWSEKTLTDVVYLCSAAAFFLSVMLGHGLKLES